MNGVIPYAGNYAVLWNGKTYPFLTKESAEGAYKKFKSGMEPKLFFSEEDNPKFN